MSPSGDALDALPARLSRVTIRGSRLRAATVALALASTAFVGGCSMLSPVQTDVNYQAPDGVPLNLGPLALRNLVVVSENKDAPGTLVGNVYNPTNAPVSVAFAAGNASVTVDVPAYTSRDLSVADNETVLSTVASPPGGMLTFTVTSAVGGTANVAVPVLNSQSYYKTLIPTAVPTTSATESPSATPTSTASATATSTP